MNIQNNSNLIFRSAFAAGALTYGAAAVCSPYFSLGAGVSGLILGLIVGTYGFEGKGVGRSDLATAIVFCLCAVPYIAAGLLDSGTMLVATPPVLRFVWFLYVVAGAGMAVVFVVQSLPVLNTPVTWWKLVTTFALGILMSGQAGPAALLCFGAVR